MEARGEEILHLPNVAIRVFPFIDTTLHDVAVVDDPEWLLRVRHRTGIWGHETRPVLMLQPTNGLNIYFKFRLPTRPLLTEPHQVWTGLHNGGLELVHLATNGHVRADFELETLRKINDVREERLRTTMPVSELPPVQTGEIIDISTLQPRTLVAA